MGRGASLGLLLPNILCQAFGVRNKEARQWEMFLGAQENCWKRPPDEEPGFEK